MRVQGHASCAQFKMLNIPQNGSVVIIKIAFTDTLVGSICVSILNIVMGNVNTGFTEE